MTIQRKLVAAEVNTLADDEVEIILTTDSLARDGHVLLPQGANLRNYLANPIVLWSHDINQPVGNASDLVVDPTKIRARVKFAGIGISAKADEVRGLVKTGVVRGVSIGFEPIVYEPLDPKKPRGGQRVSEYDLLECSFCSIPVDTGAGVSARAITGDDFPAFPDLKETRMTEKTPDKTFKRLVQRMHVGNVMGIKTRGLYSVCQLAYALSGLGSIHSDAVWEAEMEADESKVPGMLAAVLHDMGDALVEMTKEEVAELLASHPMVDDDGIEIALETRGISPADVAYVRAAKTPMMRAWREGIVLARAGKALSATNEKKLNEADDSLARATKHHRAIGGQHKDMGGNMDAITTAQVKASKAQEGIGDALTKAAAEPDKADAHIARAVKQNDALADHLGAIDDAHRSMSDTHADMGDSHAAMGRAMKAATRSMRSVVDGATTTADDTDGNSTDVQTSGGDSDDNGSRAIDDFDYRKRQLDILRLGPAE